jgi:hypothetical protein
MLALGLKRMDKQHDALHTVKEEQKMFLTYEEVQEGSGAKSYKYLRLFYIYQEAHPHI